ncbi:MAG: DUF1330 domain-containing protein [Alphaproteobacteria bacterium]|nr:DUF1330 domain-containing protein [Alphaproteobacteria bacterium]
MTVYIIARFKIHDRAGYDRYEENFMDVFEPFGGTMLSVDEEPTVLQGEFDFTRSVLIAFSNAEAAMAWMGSPEYQEIAKHRLEASVGNAIMVKGLEDE